MWIYLTYISMISCLFRTLKLTLNEWLAYQTQGRYAAMVEVLTLISKR